MIDLRYYVQQIFTNIRDIEESYDQIVHPQKRRDIRIILDIVMVRMLQLKRNPFNIHFIRFMLELYIIG